MSYAIGVDLGGTNMRAALVDEHGKIHAQARTKTPVEEGPEATAQAMGLLVREVMGSETVLGVGIGSPGPLSRSEKMIYQSANLPGFDRFPLGKRIEELTGKNVFLDNDAKCATYGEAVFGRAKGRKNFILMTFGTGIGGGIVVDGKMIYGKSDGACEVGHLTLHAEGKLCKCGNRGCFEQYASATAFKARGFEKSGQELGGKEIFEAFDRGQKWAAELIREFTIDLAIGTASLVNIFDPELVVFGGGLFTLGGGPLCAWVQEAIKDRCFKSSQKGLEIAASSLGGDAGVLGAASLVFGRD
ncbi:MAG: ROK family protein [Bdellovibrionota bacterium]